MRKIETGMLVRIVAKPSDGISPDDEIVAAKYSGHIGTAIRVWDAPSGYGQRWEVSGADPEDLCWPEWLLEPIDPPKATTWEHVAEDTGWNPTKQPVT